MELDLLHSGAGGGGRSDLRLLVNPGLSVLDERGIRQPVIAEAIPTLENGLWQLLPDGRMETTWKLRPGTRWHDGAPFTTEDLLFTTSVGRDQDLPAFAHTVYRAIDGILALDPYTITVSWRAPYVEADFMFVYGVTLPMPKHLLENAFREDKSNITNLPFWTEDYVGLGPYRVREWSAGSHVLLAANDNYVLGRPRIDEIEVRFIPDANALMANILAGSVDLMLGTLGSVDQGIALRDQWRDGKVSFSFDSNDWIAAYPQLMGSRPAIVSDVRFRRALMHTLDRKEMVDSLQSGISAVADSYLSPGQLDYRDIEARLPRYEYDPRRATQMIEELGYSRGADGTFRDVANEVLHIEIRSLPAAQTVRPATTVADYWQRVGVSTSLVPDSPQLLQDLEYRATFPAFYVLNQGNDIIGLPNLHSSRTRLPENRFQVPGNGNWSRYINPELDGLIDTYLTTIPKRERIETLGQVIYRIADQLTIMGLYYNPRPEPVANRLMNVHPQRAPRSPIVWNAHEWDLP